MPKQPSKKDLEAQFLTDSDAGAWTAPAAPEQTQQPAPIVQTGRAAKSAPQERREATRSQHTTRAGKALISGYLPASYHFHLSALALQDSAERGSKVYLQDVMQEAFDEYFRKRGIKV